MNNKLIAGAVSLCLLASFLLPACGHTPNQPITDSGDDTELNTDEVTAAPTPEPEEENLASIYGFPKYRKDEFNCADTSVKVNVNMTITVPDVKTVPVFEAKPTTFSPEFVKNFAEKMHPGVTFYDREDLWTKEQIQERIDYCREHLGIDEGIDSYEKFAEYYAEKTGETDPLYVEYTYGTYTYALEEYQKLLDTAPDVPSTTKPVDFQYHDLYGYYIYYDPESRFGYAYGDDAEDPNDGAKYIIMNGVDGDTNIRIYVKSRFDYDVTSELIYNTDISENDAKPLTLSKDEVIELGLDTLKKMGVEDEFMLTSSKFYYGPNLLIKPYDQYNTIYQGILTYQRRNSGAAARDIVIENDSGTINTREYIKIEILNDKVVYIEFKCPYEVTKVEDENVKLLSYDEAYAAFKQQMSAEYSKSTVSFSSEIVDGQKVIHDEGVRGATININNAELFLMQIPTEDGGYRCVPAWQFSGTRELDVETAYAHRYDKFNNIVFLTINAVDGSRITGGYIAADTWTGEAPYTYRWPLMLD